MTPNLPKISSNPIDEKIGVCKFVSIAFLPTTGAFKTNKEQVIICLHELIAKESIWRAKDSFAMQVWSSGKTIHVSY